MTPTPPTLLPEPGVARAEVVGLSGPWIELKIHSDLVEAPEALYCNEFWDTEPTHSEGIVALVDRLQLDVIPVWRERWRDVRSPHRGQTYADAHTIYEQEVSNWAEALGLPGVERDPHFGPKYAKTEIAAVHVAEVAYRLWVMKALVSSIAGDNHVQSSPYGVSDFPSQIERIWDSRIAGWSSLLLAPFAPRFILTGQTHMSQEDLRLEERRGWPPTAFEVAALQLFNDLNRKSEFDHCKRCERPFLFQRGRGVQPRAKTGRRRDAVYCTNTCASAAAQAASRERRRALGLTTSKRTGPEAS